MNRLGSVLPEEEWSKVQKKLCVEFQRHVMSNYKQMKAAADMPVYFLLGATSPWETSSLYGRRGESASIGTDKFVVVMNDLVYEGVLQDNEEFQKALEQMMKIAEMTNQFPEEAPQEALQEPPAAPAATKNPEMTEISQALEATLVMDEDESLAGAGKGKGKRPKQTPTELKDAAFETPGAVPAMGQGGETFSADPPPENPPVQEDQTEYPMEEIGQMEQENDDEEKNEESNDAAPTAASDMDLDSQSVKNTSRKRKRGTKKKVKTTPKGSGAPKRTKSKSSPQLDENEGPMLHIPTFTKVKPLLEKAGYTFRKDVYCRPKGDPKKYPNAVEGIDYFATESAFREFLCQTGVDCNGKEWTDGEKENAIVDILTPWIRYNVIKSRKGESVLPDFDMVTRGAIKMLKKLKFCHLWRLEGYSLPDVPATEAKLGINTFSEKPDLWVYLARHGLPDNCPFENVTPSERLALEQFIARFDHEDVDL